MNYAGLAELGWRATQIISGKNGYYEWERMTGAEKQVLQRGWLELPESERKRLERIVCAATDAFATAIVT